LLRKQQKTLGAGPLFATPCRPTFEPKGGVPIGLLEPARCLLDVCSIFARSRKHPIILGGHETKVLSLWHNTAAGDRKAMGLTSRGWLLSGWLPVGWVTVCGPVHRISIMKTNVNSVSYPSGAGKSSVTEVKAGRV